MLKSALLSAVMALSFVNVASAATFTILYEDDFDANPVGLNATPSGWNVTGGTVDIIGDRPSPFFNFYPNNGNYIDMDGTSLDAGRMTTTQVFDFLAGVTYRLYFTLGQNGTATETLNFGFDFLADSITGSGGIAPTMVDRFFDFTLASNQSSALFFEGVGGDNQGYIVDNVILKSLDDVSPIPLPATAPLVLLGLAGLTALRRRKSI